MISQRPSPMFYYGPTSLCIEYQWFIKWLCHPIPKLYADDTNLGLHSLSRRSYHKIFWSVVAARFGFRLFESLWNLSHIRAIRSLWHPISRLRDFTKTDGKTSYRIVNRGPVPQGEYMIRRYVASTWNLKSINTWFEVDNLSLDI